MSIRKIDMNIWIVVHCPKCGQKNSIGLVKFSDAIDHQSPLECVACGVDMYVELTCQTRATELRNEAEAGEHTCPSCEGRGMRAYGNEPGLWYCYACKGTGQV